VANDARISPVKQKEKRIDEDDQRITHRHIEVFVKVYRQAFYDEISDYTCDKYNEDIDQENNPTRKVAHIPEPFFGHIIHDVFKSSFHQLLLIEQNNHFNPQL
jgi:hypothetical protein